MSSTSRYEAYLSRRRLGGPREMFPTKEYATEWLRLAGVVKYVDGGWLSGVLDVASGRAAGLPESEFKESGALERSVGKMAWQVISEEFGDGDLTKNHVYVYERLLESLSTGGIDATGRAIPGFQQGFDGLPDDQGAPRCWEAAIAQQCIGLLASSREFFPEAIGFNMAYEALPYHLLVTSRELRELGIDDYYFALHVTIDNADSGHAAIARVAVERYLEGIRKRDGQEAMEKMWRRVQAGYILAEGLPTTPCSPKEFEPVKGSDGLQTWRMVQAAADADPMATASDVEKRLIDLLGRKSFAAEKMHCPSRMTIQGKTIEEWLDPHSWTAEKGLAFVRALGEKKPWVHHGDPAKSKLVKELEWGGRMFGAFSKRETELVRVWIRSLGADKVDEVEQVNNLCGTYATFVGEVPNKARSLSDEQLEDPLIKLVVDPLRSTPERSIAEICRRFPSVNETDMPVTLDELLAESRKTDQLTRPVDVSKVLPVWLVSSSLMELFPFSPTKFATPLGSSVLRLLRTQFGFGALHNVEDICAGMDDIGHDLDTPEDINGLWELAEDLYRREGLAVPSDIVEVIQNIHDERVRIFCRELLELRTRPYAAQAHIFGITLGFAEHLHGSERVTSLFDGDVDSCKTLERIVKEEKAAVVDCIEYQTKYRQTQEESDDWWKGVVIGYRMARRESEWLLQ